MGAGHQHQTSCVRPAAARAAAGAARRKALLRSLGDMWAQTVVCAALLGVLCPTGAAEVTEVKRGPRHVQDSLHNSHRLLGALHEVLEKLQTTKINPWEKKYGQVPSCDLGELCAVRKGSRIGKMCDCPRGAFCNFFLLKCL